MNIEDKFAKPDKTIGQHSNELIEQAKLLYKLGYIKSDELYSDLLVACKKHDYGKANSQFQKRVQRGGKFQPELEIPHNVLSIFYIDKSECNKPDSVYFAVMYHHDNKESPITVFGENKELIETFISELGLETASYNKMKRNVKKRPVRQKTQRTRKTIRCFVKRLFAQMRLQCKCRH